MITPTRTEPSTDSISHKFMHCALHLHLRRSFLASTWMVELLRSGVVALLAAAIAGLCAPLSAPLIAQGSLPTGPQALVFSGLSAGPDPSLPQSQINAAAVDAQGNLYLLLNDGDGIRLLKTDPAASAALGQAKIGAAGDIGLALALDNSGNVYITGTTSSGILAATSGAAFTGPSGTAINSFVARFDSGLHSTFVTFAGGASMAASSVAVTSDAVFVAGTIFSASLPVTPSAITQAPAYGSTQNGFVEKFSADGRRLIYANYLSGASGGTTASAIAADSSDNAYIAGTTTSAGYPTIAAVVPEMLGATSGFLTKLTPAGDGITFSTYIPGAGIASLALDPAATNILLTGAVSLGQFPVATIANPLTATSYQVLVRMTLDGSTVLGSTVLAPGTQSYVTPGTSGSAWVVGDLSLPVLPMTPLSSIGNSYAVHVNAANQVDQTTRLGGIAASNPANAGAPVMLTSLAVNSSGDAFLAGSFQPYASQAQLSTQTFDLPLAGAATAAFPSSVHRAVMPAPACHGSLCAGSAAYLARVATPASPSATQPALALSVDDAPNLTLRNLGSAAAGGVAIDVTGFTQANDCPLTLAAGGECTIALTGTGPGTIVVSATNATSAVQTLPAVASSNTALPIAFAPRELDFGIVSSASGTVSRTLTVTNLTQQSQSFASLPDLGVHSALPYTFAEIGGDCTISGVSTKLLAPGSACHIVIGLTVSNTPSNDGPLEQNWKIGTRDVQMTAYAQAAALSLSAAEIDFGTQYAAGLRLPRYLYLSNNSTVAATHAAVTLPGNSSFSVTDACPQTLNPFTICRIQLAYQAAHTPSADSVTLSLDQGLTALVTGRTLPQPSVGGASVNPNLSLSNTALSFPGTVAVTATSSSVQTVTIQNTGASAFALAIALTGDFSDTTNCGASLAGNSSCSVVFTFAPSAPGARQGLLSVTAGAGSTPAFVALSGTANPILSPANNGTLNFDGVIAGQPSVQWYKVTQPFTSFSASAASTTLGFPYTVILVEDIGYGHGQPPAAAFGLSASGTCLNCWLGVRFTPPAIGSPNSAQTGTLTFASSASGSPYVLALVGYGLPETGLLLTPVTKDFGPATVNSVSAAFLFTATNLTSGGGAINIGSPTLTGDFAVSAATTGGAICGGTLAYSASCLVEVAFAPTAVGPRSGGLTIQAGTASATAQLTGYGAPDPGIALTPTALVFSNVPSGTSTVQSITLTNTGGIAAQVGTPTVSSTGSFSATSTCSALAPGATCSIPVTFTPATAPATATLNIPITISIGGAPSLTIYSVPLTGSYTTQNSGLGIVPASLAFGPRATGTPSASHQFTLNNLTGKQLAVSLALPRQFVLIGPTCASLAPAASCNFSVSFLPLTGAEITGTLLAQATPSDGSAALTGLAYLEGYGMAASALTITGGPAAGAPLGFGQVPSGQSTQRTLTLVNTSSATLTIRRITSPWPFLSTTTCGPTLIAGTSCAVALSYTPLNQVAAGSTSAPSLNDTGTLTIESDAASSPDLVNLAGSSASVTVGSPSNTAALAALTPSASSLSFASTPAGTASGPQTVTLTNSGGATLAISSVQTSPDFSTTNDCTTLLPLASCNLTVTFTPQQAGSITGIRTSAVEITSNSATSLEFISLAGTSASETLTVFPASLSFATTLAGSSSILTLQLTNSGSGPVTLTALTATGDYTVSNGTCPSGSGTLAAGSTCAMQVNFTPTQTGARTGTLSIANSTTSLPLAVPLIGTAIQSHLVIAPSSLSFGSIAVGSSTGLSLTLANTGSAPITSIALGITGDYTIVSPCSLTTLVPQASCSVTIAFAPTAAGARPSTLTVTSSDPTSPAAVPLTGTGTVTSIASFTLTVNGSSAAASTVATGTAATYSLSVAPVNGFAGTVVLNCTPLAPATYATCSLLPSSVTLTGTAQASVATLTTVASVASNTSPGSRSFGNTAFCLFFPALIFTWKARRSGHRAWRVVGPVAWAILASVALLTTSACGSNNVVTTSLRYSPSGSFQYQVTATSTASGTPVAHSVLLNLTVR